MKCYFSPASATGYLELQLRHRLARLRAASGDAGASAVEWVVISAIVIAIVIAVGVTLRAALTDRATGISDEIGGSGAP